jgi:heme oxygenase
LIGHIAVHNLGLGRDGGASFLGLYGAATRAALDRLRGWIDSVAFSEPEREEAVATAFATFAAVGRWHRLMEEWFAGGSQA